MLCVEERGLSSSGAKLASLEDFLPSREIDGIASLSAWRYPESRLNLIAKKVGMILKLTRSVDGVMQQPD